jgi:alkylated DNA repair dioxygenase AlkB
MSCFAGANEAETQASVARKSMTPQAQNDLFETEDAPVAFDSSFSSARRVAIDDRSWIEVVPGWVSGAAVLRLRLAQTVSWAQHDRKIFDQTFIEPRLTSEYRDLALAPEMALREAAALLSKRYGVTYDSVWLNLYRNGADSTGWHRDRFSCRRPECVVPVLSLGAKRRFLVKPRSGGESIPFKPGSGDLVVMGGRCQEDWLHSVPKDTSVAESRISVNFQSSQQATRVTR